MCGIGAGAVTGIGSLPFTSVKEALHSVAESSPQIPFWPQLPQLSERESAVRQGLGILGDLIEARNEGYGYQVRSGCMDAALAILHAAGFRGFEEALSTGVFGSAEAVKGQVEGPITLSAYLFYKGRPFLSDAALFAAIAFHVSQTICWQVERLKSAGLPVLLFVDEPALCLEALPHAVPEERRLHALTATLDDARTHGAFAGLHCCAARPFERMCRVRPDILSFDAHEGLELFFADAGARKFVRDAGTVAYGLIPTRPCLDDVDPARLFTRWLQAATLAGDPQQLARTAMVTATCGLGLLNPASVAPSFKAAHAVSKSLRALAGYSGGS